METYSMTKDLMFDYRSYYQRIAEQMSDNCRVVEVGVANGNSALYLAKKLNQLGKTFTLYMVDNMDYGQYDQLVTIYENIIESGLGTFIKVIPCDSVEASKKFNDNSLGFVFLDSSHLYEPTKEEIKVWYPKLKDDCILSGHDFFGHKEVNKAVKEMIPETIKRETIDIKETGQYREFEPEQFLHTEQTENKFGVWWVQKKFYWQPKLL